MTHVPQHNPLLFYLLILNDALCVDTLFPRARLYRTNRLLHYMLLEFDRFGPLPCVITVMEHEVSLASLQKLTIFSCSESLSQYVCVCVCILPFYCRPKIHNTILYSCGINFDFICPFRKLPFCFSLLSLRCMDTIRTVIKLTDWEPCSSRPVGRPRMRWLEQVEEDLKKMEVRNWREKCKDRRLWNEILKQAKTNRGW